MAVVGKVPCCFGEQKLSDIPLVVEEFKKNAIWWISKERCSEKLSTNTVHVLGLDGF